MKCPEVRRPENWDAVESVFREAPSMDFGQSWLAEADPAFRPGRVRIGWHADRFCYFGELVDDFPATRALGRNEPLWQLGDVLELFAGVNGQPAYVEYHTAPNGRILQLLWPDSAALGSIKCEGDLTRFMVKDDRAVSWARTVKDGWQVYGELPVSSLPGGSVPLIGQTWQVSFGRYDAHADGSFTLSSTSPLTVPSYHRRQEWREIEFV